MKGCSGLLGACQLIRIVEVQMSTAFSLRISVADGDPGGLRIVERLNCIGKALILAPVSRIQCG